MGRNRPQLDLTTDAQTAMQQITAEMDNLYSMGGKQDLTFGIDRLGGITLREPSLDDQIRARYRDAVTAIVEIACAHSGLHPTDLAMAFLFNGRAHEYTFDEEGEPLAAQPHRDGTAMLLSVLSPNPNQPCTEYYPGAQKLLPRDTFHRLFVDHRRLSSSSTARLTELTQRGLIRPIQTKPGEICAHGPGTLHRRIWNGAENTPDDLRTLFLAEVNSAISPDPRVVLRRARFLYQHATH